MGERAQSPVFARLSDLTLWIFEHTQKFPKHERFRLGQQLEQGCFILRDALIRAAKNKREVDSFLADASIQLDILLSNLRLAHRLRLFSTNQYFFASEKMVELGKLIGGWKKKINTE